MQDLNQGLILALVFVPTLFGIFRLPKEMAIAAAAIAVALSFANLDKFVKFKSGFFEAELKTAVDKTYAAIDQLKQLGLALSGPIVDDIALSGRMFQFIPLKYKLQRIEHIADTLRTLGATQDEIDKACRTIFARVEADHARRVGAALLAANPSVEKKIFEGDSRFDDFRPSNFETFIKENKLQRNTEVEEKLADFQFFLEKHKLRHEDDWQS